jgi:hypothetical protein
MSHLPHVRYMRTQFCSGRLKGRNHLKDLGIDGMIILKCIFGKLSLECGLNSSGSGYGPVASSCKHCSKPSGSIKGGEFLD